MKYSLLVLVFVLIVAICCSCTPPHQHDFSDSYSYDEVNHWHECECGEKADTTEHSWNNGVVNLKPTTESEGERTYTCTVCRGKKTEKIEKLDPGHIHAYDNLNYDENQHWYECECGEINAKLAHNFDGGVITQHPTVDSEGVRTFTCSVCKYAKTESIDKLDPDHLTHEFNVSSSDEKNHWIECVCGERSEVTAHSWDGGVETIPAGDIAIGIKTFTCTDCGRKATENIPAQTANGLSFLKSTHYRIYNKLANTPLTLEAEIQVSPSVSGRAGAIFGNYIGIRQDWLFEIYENGVPRFYFVDAAGNIKDYRFDKVDVRSNDFVHVALVVDFANNGVHLYIKGELKQTVPMDIDLAPDVTRYQFVVGGDNRSDNGIYFKGQIRSVAAYSDVRSADEIAHSALHGTNLYADDLILSYLLNESNAGKDIEDLSGNGYTIPKEWLDSHEPTLDYAYSFAVVGDTQWLSKYTPEKMEALYDWILANKNSKNIAHVFGLGDITEDWNTAGKEAEWIRAQQYISKLDGVIPYSLVRGNHDESKYFFKYFANETYMSQFDGFMGGDDISNSYKLFTVGSTDYLFLTLDFGPSDEALEWANEVVLAHPNHRVIITTHGYQGFDGDHLTFDNTPSSGGMGSANDVDTSVGDNFRGYNNGQQVWDKFIAKHPNIFLVMSGHTPDEDVLVLESKGNHGNTVTQMLIDAQWMDPQKGGVGMVAMLYFSADGTQMEVEWISTDTGKYYKEHNQFTLDLSDSFNVPSHDFKNAYDENSHQKMCDCGYVIDEQPHEFDGGVLNSDGFMVYSCECGYQRVTSATDDPVAKDLQTLLEEYYNNGTYFVNSYFFGGDKFWTDDAEDYKLTADYLTLYDLILGRYGDLKLDLGWNSYDGVYSSSNESAIKGVAMFVQAAKADEVNISGLTKVSIEADGAHLIIKLYAGESVSSTTTVGLYATTTLVNHAGDTLQVIYTKVGADYMCEIITPSISGLVAEYDKIILDSRHSDLTKTVYCSTISVWDGVSVSTGLKGSGTEADPYLVESGADLMYIANEVNKLAEKGMAFSGKYFKLTASIDLNGHELCIGTYPGWGTRQIFGGFFDGNHCTIRGLNNTKSLFGAVEGGWLKNLSVYGTVRGTHEATGGIVGYVANGGSLENLTSYVTVNGTSTLGGIVGNAESQASTVINCVNYGNVTGSSYIIGGIAGSGGHNITDCVNFGNVTSTGNDCVGGVVGSTKNTGSISNCYNYGTVNARGKAGGIVGQANKPIINCVNYGEVNGTWALGGILGFVATDATASITDCVNSGNVNATSTGIGGIFGILLDSATATGSITIDGCVNNGSVKGSWGVGGIAGDTIGVISNCINNGTISAEGDLGGIIGKCYGKVTECTNNGKVVGTKDIIGGIVGNLHVTTHGKVICTTNYQKGTVTGPNSQELIGKGYVYVEEDTDETGPLTEEEFNAQPITRGNGWDEQTTKRAKIYIKIKMDKGTKITFIADTNVYRWSVIETTDPDRPASGTYKDSGWNTTWTGSKTEYTTNVYSSAYLILTVSLVSNGELTDNDISDLHSMFIVDGNKAASSTGGTVNENNPWLDEDMVSINHRGWHKAPENTLSAYRESYNQGFKYVECDVQFTKDGVPVLLHDDTIDRTSNGSGAVSSLTYAQLLQYDFSYDDNDTANDFSAYRGEKIPTFEEFIALCKELGLHPYIEIKGTISEAQANQLVKIVSDAGMLDSVSWLSFSGDALAKVVAIDSSARLVWVMTDTYATKIAANNIPFAQANLMTGESEVVFDLWHSLATQDVVDLLQRYNIPLEVWTVNDINVIHNLNPYVSGVTSDSLNAKEILSK